jgi:hypothetical protein
MSESLIISLDSQVDSLEIVGGKGRSLANLPTQDSTSSFSGCDITGNQTRIRLYIAGTPPNP